MSDHRLTDAAYIGNEDQLLSYMEGKLTDGTAEGVKFVHVENGGNLSVQLLPGKGFDIYQVRFKGQNMNYIAPSGIRSNGYYDGREDHFLRNFYVGQLTTVGLQNLGPERRVYGELQGLHGRVGNTEAENISYKRGVTEDGRATLELQGTVREGRIFGENLKLERTVAFVYGEDSFTVSDTITNEGFEPRQYVTMYHINFGYPLLEEGAKLTLDSEGVTPRSEEAAKYIDTWNVMEAPASPYPERCYFHKVRRDENGMCKYSLYNEKRGIGASVEYKGTDLPEFCEWKMLGKGEYVLGLEPSNISLGDVAPGEEGCRGPILQPGESKTYTVKFSYFS